jgi:hypothetical protein
MSIQLTVLLFLIGCGVLVSIYTLVEYSIHKANEKGGES